MDPEGYSSLVLMAAGPPDRTVLFLIRALEVSVQRGPVDDSRLVQVRVGEWAHLPIASSSIETIVIELDAVGEGSRQHVLGEIRRVLRPNGCCVAVVSHRRRARQARNLLGYRLTPPVRRWAPLLAAVPFEQRASAMLWFEGTRLVEMRPSRESGPRTLVRGDGDAAAIVLTDPSRTADGSAMDALVERLEDVTSQGVSVERVLTRKIGKTVAFLQTCAGLRFVARIARSTVALARGSRNHDALQAVRELPGEARRRLLPRPILRARLGGSPVFVEECLPGRPLKPKNGAGLTWEPRALQFITDLHVVTSVRTAVDAPTFHRLIASALGAIEPHCGRPEQHIALALLRETLSGGLLGREVPLVRSHGDFTSENCLYDDRGGLSGVVDWELSSSTALPLLDLLQLMNIPGESGADRRWRRADVVLDGVEGRGPLSGAPEIAHYAETIGLDVSLVPWLLLTHWVDHVAARIEVRSWDAPWMHRRVHLPLARIGDILSRSNAGGAGPARW